MENMAVAPALNTAVEAILPACTLQVSRMSAPAASMTIWMTRFILRRSIVPPSPVGNLGRSTSKAPRTTTAAMAPRKIQVAR